MGCSDDKSIRVDNEETEQNQEEDSSYEKEFPELEEYNSM